MVYNFKERITHNALALVGLRNIRWKVVSFCSDFVNQ